MIRFAYVCSGNLCRSPMAAFLTEHHARQRGLDVMVVSMGTLGLLYESVPDHVLTAMQEVGIDISRHRSQPLSAQVLRHADHLLIMEPAHVRALERESPLLVRKARMMGELDPEGGPAEIADPIGRDLPEFRACRDRLDRIVQALLDQVSEASPERPEGAPG